MQNFLANNEWARNPSFDHFWRHYAVCDEWRKQHFEAVRQAQSHVKEEPEVVERLSRCGIREEEEQEMENLEWHKFQEKRKSTDKIKEQREAEGTSKPWLQKGSDDYIGVEQSESIKFEKNNLQTAIFWKNKPAACGD
uniref:Uncharacterized protein n=1 Tax=Caenorhabditis japonica TaxID=281687 RepID=A0A8R1I5R2_CAEJA